MNHYYCEKDGVVVNTITLEDGSEELIDVIKEEFGYDDIQPLTKNISVGQSVSEIENATTISFLEEGENIEIFAVAPTDLPDSDTPPDLTKP
jgi:hypothetical protein